MMTGLPLLLLLLFLNAFKPSITIVPRQSRNEREQPNNLKFPRYYYPQHLSLFQKLL
jgi:hypothetical protein